MLDVIKGPGFFRFVLAVLVVIDHSTRLALGGTAVDLFFILSGYWIATMWRGRYAQTREPYLTYLASRSWRLLPVFIICSAIAWGEVLINARLPTRLDWPHQVVSNLFLLGYRSLDFQANGPAWSLDVESQFYILAPLLIFLAAHNVRWTLICSAAIAICAWLVGDTVSLLPYLPFFSIGLISAEVGWKPGNELARTAVMMFGAILAICLMSPLRGVLLGGTNAGLLFQYHLVAEVVLTFPLVPWAIFTTRQAGAKLDGLCGDLSYLVYLLHLPVLRMFDTSTGTFIERGAKVGADFLLILALSLIIWALVDRPMNRWRSRWVRRRAVAGLAPAIAP